MARSLSKFRPGRLTKALKPFARFAPSDQAAFDMFSGSWSSAIPGVETNGSFPATQDNRLTWMLEEVGSLEGRKVLELGPLEGGHSYLMEQAGAEVTAIEANYGAFLRCLVVKNHLDMRAKFQLGDFLKAEFDERFDLVLACGVLYHMTDPVGMLRKFCGMSDRIFIWTHYFDPDVSKWHRNARLARHLGKWNHRKVKTQDVDGVTVRTVQQNYLRILDWVGFCGGTEKHSNWMFREDMLNVVRSCGMTDIRINFDEPGHPHGPAFAFVASRP